MSKSNTYLFKQSTITTESGLQLLASIMCKNHVTFEIDLLLTLHEVYMDN